MANKFLTTNIVDPVKAPITKRSLEHINSMSELVGDALVEALVGSYTTGDIIVLSGCVVTVTGGSIPGTGTATLSAGYVYRNGEVFAVDANASLSTTNPQTLVWVADDQDLAGDPATFSDGNSYDFHRVAKLKLQAGTAGSGLANYDAATVKTKSNTKYATDALTGPVTDGSTGVTFSTSIQISRIANICFISGEIIATVPSGAVATTLNGLSNYTIELPVISHFTPKQISGATSRGLVYVQKGNVFNSSAFGTGKIQIQLPGPVVLFIPGAFSGYTVLNGDVFTFKFSGQYEC